MFFCIGCLADRWSAWKKEKIKNFLDFVPLIILAVYAISMCWIVLTTSFAFSWKNIAGLLILPINLLLFRMNHKIGVLLLGFTLVLCLFSILSYTPGLTRSSLTFGLNDNILAFGGQSIYLLWLTIHFIISGRHYVGILTKKYWRVMFAGSR